MRQRSTHVVLLVSLLGSLFLIASCNQGRLIDKTVSPQDEFRAKNYVDLLRNSRFDEIETTADPSIQDAGTRDQLVAMAAMFPAQIPLSVKVVGVNTFYSPVAAGTNLTLEYEFPGKWLLANVVTQKKNGATTLTGFHVTPIADSLENLNRFSLAGKSPSHYAVLLLGIAAVLLSIYAFVVCLRARLGRSKWFWAIICLLGVGQLGINWTTGQVGFALLAIHLPPAGASAALYGPWVVYVALPVGAILFLMLRERLQRRQVQSEVTESQIIS